MKYLKLFEQIKNEPQIGDYVVCKCDNAGLDEISTYMNNNIGKILKDIGTIQQYYVKYEGVPINLFRGINNGLTSDIGFWWFDKSEIEVYSSNRKVCEIYLDTKKYNL